MVGNLCQSNYSEIFYMENEEERNPFYFLFVSIFPLQRKKKEFCYYFTLRGYTFLWETR